MTWIRAQIFLLELAQELDIGTNLSLKSRPELWSCITEEVSIINWDRNLGLSYPSLRLCNVWWSSRPPLLLTGHSFLNSSSFLMIFNAPNAPIGGIQVMFGHQKQQSPTLGSSQ